MRECDFTEAKRIFSDTKAIIKDDHFVYAKKPDGWYHGYDYVNKDAIYPLLPEVKRLCQILAIHFTRENRSIKTVVGPTVGGVILAQWFAHYWSIHGGFAQKVFPVFADEVDGERVIKRGYDAYVSGQNCISIEDVINSGNTISKTNAAIIKAGGNIVATAALCNRSGGKVTAEALGVPELVSLIDLDMKMFKENDCPICREKGQQSVRTDLGKGKEFLERVGYLTV